MFAHQIVKATTISSASQVARTHLPTIHPAPPVSTTSPHGTARTFINHNLPLTPPTPPTRSQLPIKLPRLDAPLGTNIMPLHRETSDFGLKVHQAAETPVEHPVAAEYTPTGLFINRLPFKYEKLRSQQVPAGYSNDPAELKLVEVGYLGGEFGTEFEGAVPVLVRCDKGDVKWHVFKAGDGYYMQHGRFGYLRRVQGPEIWETLAEGERLESLRGDYVYRADGRLLH